MQIVENAPDLRSRITPIQIRPIARRFARHLFATAFALPSILVCAAEIICGFVFTLFLGQSFELSPAAPLEYPVGLTLTRSRPTRLFSLWQIIRSAEHRL